MIVRSVDEGWRVVFHAAHGLLAQALASRLQVSEDLPNWPLTQIAIGMHDDSKQSFLPGERSYLTEAGAPKDFTLKSMSSQDRVKDAESQIWEATKKHRWIACLVSHHTEVLYDDESASDAMQELLREQSRWRDRTLSDLGISKQNLQRSYDWMRWCDRCSLILAGNDIPAMQRHVEIITDHNGQRFDLRRDDDGSLRVTPWPFVDRSLEVSIESRTLRKLCFADDADLAETLKANPVSSISFQFRDSAQS